MMDVMCQTVQEPPQHRIPTTIFLQAGVQSKRQLTCDTFLSYF